MAETCCIEGCVSTKEDVTYFKFPNSKTLRRRWLEAIAVPVKVTLDTAVCSQHFLAGQYELVRGKRRLKAKVVPSVFHTNTKSKSPQRDKPDSSDSEDSIPLQTVKSVTTEYTDTELRPSDPDSPRPSPDHRLEDRLDTTTNGDKEDDIVRRKQPDCISMTDLESNKDIEDIIAQYQIKQIRPVHKQTDIQADTNNATDTSIEVEVPAATAGDMGIGNKEIERNWEVDNIIDVDEEVEPVFIEVAVGKGGGVEEVNNQDCMMLLESVQCEVDPSCLMFPPEDPDPDPDPGDDSDVIDLGEKKEDPVSLLTSSDEDEVIIEEPKYDMIEVSDETDEDDVPLVKLVDRHADTTKDKINKDNLTKILWGKLYEFYCKECRFICTSSAEFRRHVEEHSTVVQVCEICSYTTSSKQQYTRHKRKHREDRRFNCHLCKYRARHSMSLIYHMKSHNGENAQLISESENKSKSKSKNKSKSESERKSESKRVVKCGKCSYETCSKQRLAKHVRACSARDKRYACDRCEYETDRRSDMKRHQARRHRGVRARDDDEYVPPRGRQ